MNHPRRDHPQRKIHHRPFHRRAIRVTHSLVDCVALAIETPVGIVIHTGDFKIDLSPLDGNAFDLHTFAEYGKRGVLAFFRTQPMSSAPATPPASAPLSPASTKYFPKQKRSSSSPASPHLFTASASPLIWPANMAAK